MRIFFYVGPNKLLKSGFSIKFWKIERKGRTVRAMWGAAKVDHKRRTVPRASCTNGKEWRLPSAELARTDMDRRVKEQLLQGYYRIRRRRS
jgi:hypothetical protein